MNEFENPIGSGVDLDLVPVACAMCGIAETKPHPVFEGYDYEYRTCDNRFRFVACADCGHVYLSPRCKVQDLDRIYPDSLARSSATAYRVSGLARWLKRSVFDSTWMKKVLANLQDGSSILDIGAGSGSQLLFLAERSPKNTSFYANELKFDDHARESLLARGIEVLEGPIEGIDIKVRFDAIICIQVVEHVVNPREVMGWISAHLAPGGILFLETPDLNAPARFLFKSHWGALAFPRHFHLFSRKALADLAIDNGLEIDSHYGVSAAAAWTLSLRNRLGMSAATEHRGMLRIFGYKNVFMLTIFTLIDWILMLCGCSTSNQVLIARKPQSDVP
ncbi:MAG: class I SAM-dependent methyltransferase [Gemmatimonadetes bacterium]|nr:class I SAM-dependent methyltransferase [Gemmatimonadota bacterium]MYH20047.1 class I SAM-dependent methyltransferase [Gemmatimonadota bacterium]